VQQAPISPRPTPRAREPTRAEPSPATIEDQRLAEQRTREAEKDREMGRLFGKPDDAQVVRVPEIAAQILAAPTPSQAQAIVRDFALGGFGRSRPLRVRIPGVADPVSVGRSGIFKSTSDLRLPRDHFAAVAATPELLESARLGGSSPIGMGIPKWFG
jgi:hypothetical protein